MYTKAVLQEYSMQVSQYPTTGDLLNNNCPHTMNYRAAIKNDIAEMPLLMSEKMSTTRSRKKKKKQVAKHCMQEDLYQFLSEKNK